MKQQEVITTLIIIVVVAVALYFGWNIIADIINKISMAIMGKAILTTATGVADTVGSIVR